MSVTHSNDEVILLACSGLAATRGQDLKPLGPKGWASLRLRASDAGLEMGELVSMPESDLQARLGIEHDKAQQLASLFERKGQLAFELERLGRLGVWYTTVESEDYPDPLLARLGPGASPVLFGLGNRALLDLPGLAVVGSRDADEAAMDVARRAGAAAARQGWSTVSGAARGVDSEAMRGAFETGGMVVGVTADGLERHLRDVTVRTALTDGRAAYVSSYRPDVPFSVDRAMGRDKLIYCLSSVALVAHSSNGSGRTWAGATKALKAKWAPVHVFDASGAVPGNEALIGQGGLRLHTGDLDDLEGLAAAGRPASQAVTGDVREPAQQTLF